MDGRKEILLKKIAKEYIKGAQPVSSGILAQGKDLKLSSATIRNEMVELEKEGYIYQPHTSAGRVPTDKAYRFLAEEITEGKRALMGKKNIETIRKRMKENIGTIEKREERIKALARQVAELCENAVIVAFEQGNYYTGLGKLFAQPEFREYALVCQISKLVDHLEERLVEAWPEMKKGEIRCFIGEENPLGKDCSWLVMDLSSEKYGRTFLSILGPMRMDYEKTIAVLKEVKNILN